MASSKALQMIFPFTLLLLFFFPHPNISTPMILKHNSHNMNASSLMFLKKDLQGCRVGDTIQGIHQIKKYLQRFGYITNIKKHSNYPIFDDTFDHILESALKTYQKNHNLVPSGILDSNTIAQMAMPRCGVQDVINGTTRKRNQIYKNGHTHFHKVSHFTLFEGNPKWPSSKFHLSYAFPPGYPSEAIMAVSRAFSKWALNTHFTFSHVVDYNKADIKISFERGEHGDDASFDGVGGILAHAYPPTDGRLHFDADEPWSVGAISGYFDVETVALHEIGHILGLQHSSIGTAIMFPSISAGVTKGLHWDDIAGIKALYRV
ncbi:metalloendoproteinase 2-MMP-like [Benincasa hispida]|uniref:metalloendoproteinase 2-MMP-like n=1 Tax=Benincasa hispida TaxID=102211 RepID=UPI0019008DAD|nr:metalloendoproteinase 2-MMP-like [Benincasa hispida]